MNEEVKNDPLKVLIKSSDYMKGYEEGISEEKLSYHRFACKLRYIADSIDTQETKIWRIRNGTVLLKKKFETEDGAWGEIVKMCGEKINPLLSTFVIFKSI